MKYFLHLAYQGTNYRGWQRQINVTSIQAVLEDTLSKMFKQKILCHGCGRTDAGVHASQYFCHIHIEKEWDFDAVFRINKMLPDDIKVYDFIPVPMAANAQKDAIARTYDYYIHFKDNPFLAQFSTLFLIKNPDLNSMQAAVQLLPQYRDFHSFCKQPDIYKHTLCQVSSAELTFNTSGNHLRFRITANRFLRSMIRRIVGNLIEIGKGRMTIVEFEDLLKVPKMTEPLNVAYPQGLYLAKVVYPYLEVEAKGGVFFIA